MQVKIEFEGEATIETSRDLQYLKQRMEEDCPVSILEEKQPTISGEKDSGLMVGMTIASLALGAIQTAIAVLQYWQSQRPKYKILIQFRNERYILDNASKEEVNKVVDAIRALSASTEEIEIIVSKR